MVRENVPYDFNTLIIVETCFPDQYFIKVLHEPEKMVILYFLAALFSLFQLGQVYKPCH